MSKEKKSVWETLSAIDVNDKTKEKGGMTYLSWAWAWGAGLRRRLHAPSRAPPNPDLPPNSILPIIIKMVL